LKKHKKKKLKSNPEINNKNETNTETEIQQTDHTDQSIEKNIGEEQPNDDSVNNDSNIGDVENNEEKKQKYYYKEATGKYKKRKKTRSKQKNIRKDHRPPDKKPAHIRNNNLIVV